MRLESLEKGIESENWQHAKQQTYIIYKLWMNSLTYTTSLALTTYIYAWQHQLNGDLIANY